MSHTSRETLSTYRPASGHGITEHGKPTNKKMTCLPRAVGAEPWRLPSFVRKRVARWRPLHPAVACSTHSVVLSRRFKSTDFFTGKQVDVVRLWAGPWFS